MTQTLAKISLFLGLTIFLVSCNAVKHVDENQFLLTDNTIKVDSTVVKDSKVYSQLAQKPNTKIPLINVPLGLHIFNMADNTPDSTFQGWLKKKPKREQRLINFLSKKQVIELGNSYVGFNKWLQKSGDAPVIIDEAKTTKSLERLKKYYQSFGYFNTEVDYSIQISEKKKKRAAITYKVTRHEGYIIDSILEKISSPIVDSLFQLSKGKSFIVSGNQFTNNAFGNERIRLTLQFRNSGLYYFDQDYIKFDADTVNTGHKANITYIISDRKITEGDSTRTEPFKVYRVNEVRIVTDFSYENRNKVFTDSAFYNGYKLYSYDKLKFRPKAITDAIAIVPNTIFRDLDRTITYSQISNLRIFKYPNISYLEDPSDSTGTGLIATILLSPKKKYTLGVDFDAFTSTIQQFGIGFSTTFLTRNVFRGAETLELSLRGSVGSSKDAADSESKFFNISEVGANVKLSFPRILFPTNTNKIIPKYMAPTTNISLGIDVQNNIGLDRQNFNGRFDYNWKPTNIRNYQLDLFKVQYVRNLNPENYYNVYTSSYNRLNEIATDLGYEFLDMTSENPMLILPGNGSDFNEAEFFINGILNDEFPELDVSDEVFNEVLSIAERQRRISKDDLIFATSFTWVKNTRDNISDNDYSIFRWKIESAGNLLGMASNLAGIQKNENGNYEISGVEFSQYAKFEIGYIKHWEMPDRNVIAFRSFGGIALPYGNSNSIPFIESYFAGGPNDNRGWQAYDLGPGSSGGVLDFNEANFKLAFNGEYRFTVLGSFKGALFIDAGNIWNVLDAVENEAFTFTGIEDLKEIAISSGFGLRYDFGFFVFRFDIGFKTHDPGRPEGERWFKDYNFGNAVYNIGINYPF